jgi:hypothetical protein
VTNHFEGIGVVLGAWLTRMIFTTKWAASKAAFLIEFRQRNNPRVSHIDVGSKIFGCIGSLAWLNQQVE